MKTALITIGILIILLIGFQRWKKKYRHCNCKPKARSVHPKEADLLSQCCPEAKKQGHCEAGEGTGKATNGLEKKAPGKRKVKGRP